MVIKKRAISKLHFRQLCVFGTQCVINHEHANGYMLESPLKTRKASETIVECSIMMLPALLIVHNSTCLEGIQAPNVCSSMHSRPASQLCTSLCFVSDNYINLAFVLSIISGLLVPAWCMACRLLLDRPLFPCACIFWCLNGFVSWSACVEHKACPGTFDSSKHAALFGVDCCRSHLGCCRTISHIPNVAACILLHYSYKQPLFENRETGFGRNVLHPRTSCAELRGASDSCHPQKFLDNKRLVCLCVRET